MRQRARRAGVAAARAEAAAPCPSGPDLEHMGDELGVAGGSAAGRAATVARRVTDGEREEEEGADRHRGEREHQCGEAKHP